MRGLFYFPTRRLLLSLHIVIETKVKDLNFTPSEECLEIKFVSPEEVESINAFRNVKELAEILKNKK